jgi:DNA modification methylase
MNFQGIELRQEQAYLNQQRCDESKLPCVYYTDTSENMDDYIENESIDLVFSCPPYADLEVYSDDPNDLSNMSHDDFFMVYKRILQKTYSKLKNNRFAVIVMGEVRNKKGQYIGTIPKTIEIMESAGYKYYNEIILVNSVGTLALRSGKQMQASRKVGKIHQNVLVFVKGDASVAADELGEIEINLEEADGD